MKKSVIFKNANLRMAGNLYIPEENIENKKYPAIIIVHPAGGVKEQTSGLYAQELSKRGFITLAYDASHQGESEGEPRFLEYPENRVEDIRCAVDYLTTLPYIDSEKIGLIGICGGGGYAINAAQTERRIKSVATINTFDAGTFIKEGWTGDNVTVPEVIKILEKVAVQRTHEAEGGDPVYVSYVPDEVDETTLPDIVETHEYYRTPRGQHPNSTNKCLFISFDKIIAFNAYSQLDTLLTQPLLLIAGSKAGSIWQSKRVYELTKGPKELFIIENATHIGLYDIAEYVEQAIEKLEIFFKSNL